MDAGSLAIDLTPSEDDPWLFRSYSGSQADEDGMMYLLGVGYTRSLAGWQAGVSGAGRETDANAPGKETSAIKAFLAVHAPIWKWLLEHADVMLAVDRERPDTDIWGWLITSGPNVIHAIGAKRSVIKAGLGEELILKLAGDRWEQPQIMTLELPGIRRPGHTKPKSTNVVNLVKPRGWGLDPTWLVTRMVSR